MMNIKHCFLGIIVLGALAPGVGWGQSTATDSANGGQHGAQHDSANRAKHGAQHDSANGGKQGAQHRNDKSKQHGPTALRRHNGVAAGTPAQNDASRRSLKAGDRAVAIEPSAGTNKPLATGGLTPSQHVVAPPRFASNAAIPNTEPAGSGNAVARHTSVKAGVGGPITYDAKHRALVIIGGTAMNRSRPPRFGDHE